MPSITEALNAQITVRESRRLDSFSGIRFDRSDERIDQLWGIAEATDERLAEIAQDRKLTRFGRRSETLAEVRKRLAAVGSWEEDATAGTRQHINELTGALERAAEPDDPPEDSADRLRQELRHQEIRRQIDAAGIDPLEMPMLYAQADPETRAALRNAPPRTVKNERGQIELQPLVAEDVVTEHAVGVAQRANPEQVQQLEDLRYVLDSRRAMAGTVRSELQAIAERHGVGPEELAEGASDE